MGPTTNDKVQWVFPSVELTEWEKRKIMSEVMRLAVEMMFNTHCYRFGGKVYRQTEGGPIGLRSTCAVARVVMARWDVKFKTRLEDNSIRSELDGRYVDDGRLVLYAIRAGWRWHQGALWYRQDWEVKDRALSDVERTKRAIQGAMQGLTSCLSFTVETEEDFSDGWLPTLDLKMRISEDNQIWYTFFEKPTGSDRCLQAGTALNQNCLMRSLSNDVMRRMANISKHMPIQEKVKVLDRFCQKMTNSGHILTVVRRTICSGLKGHLRKADRCLKEGKPFHRCAASSAGARRAKKLTAKQNWFKSRAKEDDKEQDNMTGQGWDRSDGEHTGGGGSKGGEKQIMIKQIQGGHRL